MKKMKWIVCLLALMISYIPIGAEGEGSTPTEAPIEETDNTLDGPEIGAPTAIVIDAVSGNILYRKNITDHYDPTSLTKIMTAYAAMDELAEDDVLTMSKDAFNTYNHDYGVLWIQQGESMSAASAVYASLLASSNDTMAMVAEGGAGSVDAMVARMNQKAVSLGLGNTNFTNVFGLNNEQNYSSAEDLAILMRAAMKQPLLKKALSASSYTIPATNMNQARVLGQDCQYLRSGSYEASEITACKIGYTNEGGWALAAVGEQDDSSMIAVVMGEATEDQAYRDVQAILVYGFSKYQTLSVTSEDIGTKTVEVMDGKKKVATVTFSIDQDFKILLPSSLDASLIKTEIQVKNEDAKNPEDVTAKVVFLLEDAQVGSVDMIRAIAYEEQAVQPTGILWLKQQVDRLSVAVVALFVLGGIFKAMHVGLRPPE